MPTHLNDRILWIFVGVGLVIAAKAVPAKLQYIRQLTQVPSEDEAHLAVAQLNDDAENQLALGTLQTLATKGSHEIRRCAVKIVAEQCVKGSAHDLLLQNLASNDPRTRDRAIIALDFLFANPLVRCTETVTLFQTERAWRSIVAALLHLLPLHNAKPNDQHQTNIAQHRLSPVLPPNRPPQEEKMLSILYIMLCGPANFKAALSAGLISRWLRWYPFPCKLSKDITDGSQPDIVKLLGRNVWDTDDSEMSAVVSMLTTSPKAMRQMRQYGLTKLANAGHLYPNLRPSWGEHESAWSDDEDIDVVMAGGEDTAGMTTVDHPIPESSARPGSSWSNAPPIWARRTPNQTRTESATRRRRREAIVVSDGDGPLTQDNILQRENSRAALAPAPNPDIEEQLTQLSEEIDREDVARQETLAAPHRVSLLDGLRASIRNRDQEAGAAWRPPSTNIRDIRNTAHMDG